MRIKSGVRQTALSLLVFCGILLAIVSVDARVRDKVAELASGGNGISLGARVTELADAMVTAARHQSIENAPLMIFAAAGAVLFVFMFKS